MSDIKQVISSPYDHIRDRISCPDEHIRDRIGSPYQHIRVGRSEHAVPSGQCASICDSYGVPIVEILVGNKQVEIIEARNFCQSKFKLMKKADAIAALNELIHYIESN